MGSLGEWGRGDKEGRRVPEWVGHPRPPRVQLAPPPILPAPARAPVNFRPGAIKWPGSQETASVEHRSRDMKVRDSNLLETSPFINVV